MKKLKNYGFIAIGVMAIASFIWANNSSSNSSDDLAMANVETLHASAAEMYCDKSDETPCKITVGDVVGESVGTLITKW